MSFGLLQSFGFIVSSLSSVMDITSLAISFKLCFELAFKHGNKVT